MSRRLLWLVAVTAFLCGAGIASAQDRPAIFLHGLLSSGSTWDRTAERLAAQLAIARYQPTTGWHAEFADQANKIRQEVPAAGRVTPVVIGHSNGGLVAREYAKTERLHGLVTLSSPNQGAPIAANARLYGMYLYTVFADIARLQQAFATSFNEGGFDDTRWVYAQVAAPVSFVAELSEIGMRTIGRYITSELVPVHKQDRPGSTFLNELNSPAGLAREEAQVPRRVGIVTSVPESHLGGPIRAALPNDWVPFHYATYASIGILDAWALHLASAGDATSLARAERLLAVGFWLKLYEPFWCQAITDPTPYAVSFNGSCHANDTFLPSWSHVLPRGTAVPVPNVDAHTNQVSTMSSVLYEVLTTHMGIAQRRTSTPSGSSTLAPGESLRPGQQLFSPDGRYRLIYQTDGNLVLYREEYGSAAWSSETWNTVPGIVTMQPDGNFVMYDPAGRALWHTYTWSHPGAYLSVRNNGSIAVNGANGVTIWHSPVPRWELDDPGGGTGDDGGAGGAGTDTLHAGDRLYAGQAITSRNGRFLLTYQGDGNLVLYASDGTPRWSTQKFGSPGYAELQVDGNFVTYDASGTPTWATGTSGVRDARLVMRDDGDVVIYIASGVVVWATHTGGS